MIPVVFINCSRFPFISLILAGLKLYETRTRNTLQALVGQRVYLAETGRGRPVVRASAVITEAFPVYSYNTYRKLRKAARITPGSKYDWKRGTKIKWFYELSDVQPVDPFIPPEGVRHGRVWMELIINMIGGKKNAVSHD